MSEDRSLGEWSSETVDSTDENNREPAVEPPTITYRCRPAGFVCAECGTETETQWLDTDTFVCPDCKSWA